MTRRAITAWMLCGALAALHAPGFSAPKAKPKPKAEHAHQFALIGHSFAHGGAEPQLEQAIASVREASLAFVVATGIKGPKEPCSDTLYLRRRELFDDSRRPIIVVPAASDWTGCTSAGRPAALDRLNRLREVFYAEPAALGMRKLTLSRLSNSAKFRSYAENAHWVVGKVLYATINLPSDNNHYRPEAGRNNEFEDRVVANRFWLNRLFATARRTGMDAVVLFSEGDIKIMSEEPGLLARLRRSGTTPTQDGFAAVRRLVGTQATRFTGKVLLVDTAPLASGTEAAIAWRDNVGHLSIGSEVLTVAVEPGAKEMFVVDKPEGQQ